MAIDANYVYLGICAGLIVIVILIFMYVYKLTKKFEDDDKLLREQIMREIGTDIEKRIRAEIAKEQVENQSCITNAEGVDYRNSASLTNPKTSPPQPSSRPRLDIPIRAPLKQDMVRKVRNINRRSEDGYIGKNKIVEPKAESWETEEDLFDEPEEAKQEQIKQRVQQSNYNQAVEEIELPEQEADEGEYDAAVPQQYAEDDPDEQEAMDYYDGSKTEVPQETEVPVQEATLPQKRQYGLFGRRINVEINTPKASEAPKPQSAPKKEKEVPIAKTAFIRNLAPIRKPKVNIKGNDNLSETSPLIKEMMDELKEDGKRY